MATAALSRRLSRRTFLAVAALGICAENHASISEWAGEQATMFKKEWVLQPHLIKRYSPEAEVLTNLQLKREADLKKQTGNLEENCWSKPLIKFRRREEEWQVVSSSGGYGAFEASPGQAEKVLEGGATKEMSKSRLGTKDVKDPETGGKDGS